MLSPAFAPHRSRRLTVAFTVSLALLSLPALVAPRVAFARPQTGSATAPVTAKKPITHDVYDSWRSIQGETLTRDGAWAVYALVPQDGDAELVARDLKSGKEWRAARGRTPLAVTPDARFVIFTIAPAKAEVDQAKKAKKRPDEMPKNALGILDLTTGKVETIERVRRFALADEGSQYLAYVIEPAPPAPARRPGATPPAAEKPAAGPTDQAAGGARAGQGRRRPGATGGTAVAGAAADAPPAELVVRDLTTGQTIVSVPEAAEGFAWNRPGTRLAYMVDSKKKPETEGVFVRDLTAGTTATPASGKGTYRDLTWDRPGDRLAFLAAPDTTPARKEDSATGDAPAAAPPAEGEKKPDAPAPAATADTPSPAFEIRLWHTGQPAAERIVPNTDPALPKGTTVSDNDGSLQFTRDGHLLFFAFKPVPKPPRPKDAPEPVKVDIWTWKDPYLQPQQKLRAEQDKKRDYAAVYRLDDKRVIPLGAADVLPSIQTGEFSTRWSLATDDTAYRQLPSWDRSYRDVYLVDLKNGARRRILTRQPASASLSPNEKWTIWWEETPDGKGGRWLAQDVEGKRPPVPLTPADSPAFCDEEQDVPSPPEPYGVAGWTKYDRSVILYDRYDLWEAFPDGRPARRLTNGRAERRAFRYVRLDTEERNLDPAVPLVLTFTDDLTKASGYARLSPLKDGATPTMTPLIRRDEKLDGLRKAKNADTVFLTKSRFDEFPDLWTAPGLTALETATRISDANPQQANYRWGKAQLVQYTSEDGVPLQGVLLTPDGFDPSKRYPLIVNIYEKMSDRLHSYVSPSPGTSINVTRYVSNGYCVLLPDIVYTTGFPGESARKCVIPAIRAVTKQGFIDEKRIGIQGHSWGGYEIAYLVTRTNIFRAAEAGAAVADMVSAYGGIRWGGGVSRAFQYERTQSRIGGAPWDKTREFIENSPIFWADRVNTPYLTIHNDEDGAVPWEQGIEFFSALRQLGKEAYMFVYNGEDHNLRSRDNTKHWTVHRDEFFDYYLLGTPRPEWMDKGVPYLEKGERDLTPFYGK